jgi:hypothetical protein
MTQTLTSPEGAPTTPSDMQIPAAQEVLPHPPTVFERLGDLPLQEDKKEYTTTHSPVPTGTRGNDRDETWGADED